MNARRTLMNVPTIVSTAMGVIIALATKVTNFQVMEKHATVSYVIMGEDLTPKPVLSPVACHSRFIMACDR